MNRQRLISTVRLTAAALLMLAAGCQQMSYHISSDPAPAEVFKTPLLNGVAGPTVKIGETPLNVTLPFDQGVSYRLELQRRQYRRATQEINFNASIKDTVPLHFTLEQYLKTTPVTAFELQKAGAREKPHLVPVARIIEGYTDVAEPSPNATDCRPVAIASEEVADITCVSASKNDDNRIVFQAVKAFSAEKYYTPEKKELLTTIADRNELTLAELQKLNGLAPNVVESPEGRRLKVSEPAAISQLFKCQADGSGISPLTTAEYLDLFPVFAWENDDVIMTSNRNSDNKEMLGLYRLKADSPLGGGLGHIARPLFQDYSPSISPSNIIYFTSITPGSKRPKICSIKIEGQDLTELADNGEFPQVSKAGDELIFLRRASEGNSNHQLWRMSVTGTNMIQMTQNTTFDISCASWSPDGKWVAYASNEVRNADGQDNYSLWLMDREGKKSVRLTANGSWDDSPTWNRSGNRIYFRSNRGGRWGIWSLKPVLASP